jgi:excisionase family DNA binding protein
MTDNEPAKGRTPDKTDRAALDRANADPTTDPALAPIPDPAGEPVRLLTTADVAAKLAVDPSTVRRWIASGALASIRAGRDYRVHPDALADLIKHHKVSTPLTLTTTRTRPQLGGHA